MLTTIMGTIMIAFIFMAVYNLFSMSPQQEKALRKIDMAKKAANAISCSFIYFIKKKK